VTDAFQFRRGFRFRSWSVEKSKTSIPTRKYERYKQLVNSNSERCRTSRQHYTSSRFRLQQPSFSSWKPEFRFESCNVERYSRFERSKPTSTNRCGMDYKKSSTLLVDTGLRTNSIRRQERSSHYSEKRSILKW